MRRRPLPVDAVLATVPDPRHLDLELGRSRQGRPIRGTRRGRGPLHVCLIGGCHADEPVGPEMLRRLASYLSSLPADSPELRRFTWYLVPHVNPDGEAANRSWSAELAEIRDHLGEPDCGFRLATYLERAVRELPGDDLEWGFPLEPEDRCSRPENLAVADFLRPGAPFALHVSFHGMAFAEGPWFLLEPEWRERTVTLRSRLTELVDSMGYGLHDVDRGGEKGFHRIDRGFSTRPDSRAMAAHFTACGDTETAGLFRPSSMELVRSLGGDPLTLVSEMPLFLMPHREPLLVGGPPLPTGTQGRLAFAAWAQARLASASADGFEAEAARHGIRPMSLKDQMRLQLAFLNEGLEAVESS